MNRARCSSCCFGKAGSQKCAGIYWSRALETKLIRAKHGTICCSLVGKASKHTTNSVARRCFHLICIALTCCHGTKHVASGDLLDNTLEVQRRFYEQSFMERRSSGSFVQRRLFKVYGLKHAAYLQCFSHERANPSASANRRFQFFSSAYRLLMLDSLKILILGGSIVLA